MTNRPRLAWVGLPAAVALFLLAPTCPTAVVAQPPVAPVAATDKTFGETITPFLNKYCNTCHNSKKQSGGLALDVYRSEAHARKDRKTWAAIEKMIASGEMPPK